MDQRSLTTREIEVLALLAQGKTNKAIADLLGIAETTVKQHVRSFYLKAGVHSRAEAAVFHQLHFAAPATSSVGADGPEEEDV